MQPFPHPNDAYDKISLRSANWLQRYSCLKLWTTDAGRTTDDGGTPEHGYTISSPTSQDLIIAKVNKALIESSKYERLQGSTLGALTLNEDMLSTKQPSSAP